MLLSVCAALLLAVERPPNFRKSYTRHATALHNHLMADYVKQVPPESVRTVDPAADGLYGSGNYSDAGTDVHVQVRFFKLEEISMVTGSMKIQTWFRNWWQDERLSWDPAAFGNITEINLGGTWLEEPDIWLPDVRVYNSKDSLQNRFDQVYATVDSSGNVFYSRPGVLDVLCKFSGLVAFPYDELSCQFEIAGWGLSGGLQGLYFRRNSQGTPIPYEINNQEATAGSSYQEYKISRIEAQLDTYFYACCPNAPWPSARYTVVVARQSAFYKDSVIIPGIMITVASFGVFFMSYQVRFCDHISPCLTPS